MNILNFGSLNLDFVYAVDHIVRPGETISSKSLNVFCGGKGLNQSVALARAGARVFHAGMIGGDGDILLDACHENGVDTSFIRRSSERTGNAIIQVAADGQNSIVLFGGANRQIEKKIVDEVLVNFVAGDMLLLQNEINLMDYLMARAMEHGMKIALNPSPCDAALTACDLGAVSLFLMNEVEGEQITGMSHPDRILERMRAMYPKADVVLTLGKNGVVYRDAAGALSSHGIYEVPVVDTTAAGDTFTGYFIAAVTEGLPAAQALRLASAASAIAVSRPGATASIPMRSEVETKAAEWER